MLLQGEWLHRAHSSPSSSQPCRLRLCGSGISLHSTFCFRLSACTFFWRFSHPPPTNPWPSPFPLPPALAQNPPAGLFPHAPLSLTCGYQLARGWEGRASISVRSPPAGGALARPALASWGEVPGEGRRPLTQPDMGICGNTGPRLAGDPKALFSHLQRRRSWGQRVEIGLSFSPNFRGVVCSLRVDLCDSAFSFWMGPLLLRPSRDHGAG